MGAALAVLLMLNVWCDRNVNWHEASVSVIETSTEAGCTPRGKIPNRLQEALKICQGFSCPRRGIPGQIRAWEP